MADLVKPSRKELSYHSKFHEDKKTMSFQGHTDTYSEDELDAFYKECVDNDDIHHIYRLVFCDDCMDFVSETEWKFEPTLDGYVWNVIVRGDLREVGYGHETLRLMKLEALKYDIHSFYTKIDVDNTIAKAFLEYEEFVIQEEDNHSILYQLEF